MKKLITLIATIACLSAAKAQDVVNVVTFLPPGTNITDSSTDYRSAFQAAINLLAHKRGGLIFVPIAGNVYVSGTVYDSAITTSKGIKIRIEGTTSPFAGYTPATNTFVMKFAGTNIFTNVATDTLFSVSVNATSTLDFKNASLSYIGASSTPSNIGIYYGNAQFMRMEDVGLFGFGINVDIKTGGMWGINRCWFSGPYLYNIRIQDSLYYDLGDNKITNSWFWGSFSQFPGKNAACTHIRIMSGGGQNIINNKFNGTVLNCIDVTGYTGTVDMNIAENSFENFTGYAFNLTMSGAAGGTGQIHFDFNQIGFLQGTTANSLVTLNSTLNAIGTVSIIGNMIGGNLFDTAIALISSVGGNLAGVTVEYNIIGSVAQKFELVNIGALSSIAATPPTVVHAITETGNKVIYDPSNGFFQTCAITGNDTLVCSNCLFGQPVNLLITQASAQQFHLIVGSGNVAQGNSTTVQMSPGSTATFVKGYTEGSFIYISDVTSALAGGQIPYWSNGTQGSNNFRIDPTTWSMAVNTSGTPSSGFDLNSGTQYFSAKFTIWGAVTGISNHFKLYKNAGTSAGVPTALGSGAYGHGMVWGEYGSGGTYIESSGITPRLVAAPNSTRAPVDLILWNKAVGTQTPADGTTNIAVLDSAGNFYANGTTYADYGFGRIQSLDNTKAQYSGHYDATHYFTLKADAGGILNISPTGITTKLPASTTAAATLNVGVGTAVTSPNAGDIYSNSTGLYYYNGSALINMAPVYAKLHATVISGTTQTLDLTAAVWVFTGSSATTWTLPALAGNTDLVYYIKNRGSATITLQRAGSDNLYTTVSVTSLVINPGESYQVVNDGSFWLIL